MDSATAGPLATFGKRKLREAVADIVNAASLWLVVMSLWSCNKQVVVNLWFIFIYCLILLLSPHHKRSWKPYINSFFIKLIKQDLIWFSVCFTCMHAYIHACFIAYCRHVIIILTNRMNISSDKLLSRISFVTIKHLVILKLALLCSDRNQGSGKLRERRRVLQDQVYRGRGRGGGK